MRASYSTSLLDAEKANQSAYSNIICFEFVRIMPAPLIHVVADPSTCKIQGRLNGDISSSGISMCCSTMSLSRIVHSAIKSARDYDLMDGRGLY